MIRLLFILVVLSSANGGLNPEVSESAGLFEGDLKLTPQQKYAIDNNLDVDAPNAFGASRYGRWTGGVMPYIIASSLEDETAKRVIRSAMEEYEERTCLKFVKRTSQANYVEFFRGGGCWSYVGMRRNKQQLSLARGCWRHGTVVHEIGHALGFWHEQSRPDRDNYVTIVWNNIREGMAMTEGGFLLKDFSIQLAMQFSPKLGFQPAKPLAIIVYRVEGLEAD